MSYTINTMPRGIRSITFDVTPDNQQLQVGDTLTIIANITLGKASASGETVRITPGIRAAGYTDTLRSKAYSIDSPNKNFSVYGSASDYTLNSSGYRGVTLTATLTVTKAILAGVADSASIFVGFHVRSNLSAALTYLSVGTTVGLTVSATGYTMPTLTAMIYGDDASSDPLSTVGAFVQGISEPTLTISATNVQKDARIGNIARGRLRVYRGSTLISTNSFTMSGSSWGKTAEVGAAGASAAGSMTWDLLLEDADGVGGTTTGSFDVLPYAAPQLTFGVTRYTEILGENNEASYEESDDGENVWLDISAITSPLNGSNAWTLTLTYSPNDNGGVLPMTLLSDTDGDTVARVHDRTLLTALFGAANDYTFVATLTDQFGSSVVTTYIYKAGGYFNVEKFGVRIGGRTTGTPQSPKFESDYPAHLYAGIADFGGSIQCGNVAALGNTSSGSYKDAVVAFPKAFAAGTTPFVMVGLASGSTSGNFGRGCVAVLPGSVTNTEFTLRFFNGDSSARNPEFVWIAIGQV